MRIGLCLVQMRSYVEAIKILTPLIDKEANLSDQVLFWLAKAQVGSADTTNPVNYQKALAGALNTFRQALERSQRLLNPQDPDTFQRRAEILLETADTQQLLKQYREAAAGYLQLLKEKAL